MSRRLKPAAPSNIIYEEVVKLPLPSVSQLGKIVTLISTSRSKLYICMRNSDSSYDWVQLAISNK